MSPLFSYGLQRIGLGSVLMFSLMVSLYPLGCLFSVFVLALLGSSSLRVQAFSRWFPLCFWLWGLSLGDQGEPPVFLLILVYFPLYGFVFECFESLGMKVSQLLLH